MLRFLPILLILHSSAVFADAKLRSVTYEITGAICTINLTAKGRFQYTSSFLDHPPRVILDFPDTKSDLRKKDIEPEDNICFSRIRIADVFYQKTNYVRVVVDLKGNMDYAVAPIRDGFSLQLTSRKDKSPSPEVLSSPGLSSDVDIFIGSEDLLEVSVFELPQFNVTARVAGDGTITMPLVGSVEVRGLTKPQAEKRIAQALEAKYINNANVSVLIKEYKSRQVTVLGGVRDPGPYYILSKRTLIQIIAEAGGLAPEAGRKCYIFRGDRKYVIDLDQLLYKGNPEMNIEIYPGDVINISPDPKIIVFVLGAVNHPGAVQMSLDYPITLVTAIASAGGLAENAKESSVQIKRKREDGTEEIFKANLKDILKGKEPDIELKSGDIINVPESFF